MALLRHIALLLALALALAVATLAVSLTPSSAQAHDGRAHAAAAAHVHAAPAAASRAASVTIRVEARMDCNGPCCSAGGQHCSSCCATGLAPAGDAAALPQMASARALARELASPDGVVPEALPEPPRPFA